MKVRLSALMALASVAAVVGCFTSAQAAQNCDLTTMSRKVTTVSQGGQTYYLDDRPTKGAATPGMVDGGGTWHYVESNGQAGLQTGGDQIVFATIVDHEDADAIGEADNCKYGWTTATHSGDTVIL